MASVLKVDKLDPQSATALEIGTSGDTVTVPSGVGLTLTNSTLLLPTTINTDKIDPKSGTDLEIGSSGDTITIPSGATITNSGTASGFGGITAASQWRLTADLTGDSTEQVFTANLEVADTDGYGSLGSAMTESSGVFTFPSTGYWLISLHGYADLLGDSQAEFRILTTVNDATYDTASEVGMGDDGSNNSNNGTCSFLFDVTSTANCKVKFACHSINSDGHVFGDSSQNETHFTFTRLGDT